MRYLVTGGAGFIGSHLAQKLLELGHEVVIADNLCTGLERNVPAKAQLIRCDLTDPASMALLPTDVAAVFHLAAQSSGTVSFQDPVADMHSHVAATLNLLLWCRQSGVKRFLYSSSTTVFGDAETIPVTETTPTAPKTYYAAGKLASEGYIRMHENLGLETSIFRLPNVYGPGQNLDNSNQGMVSIYLAELLAGRPVLVKGSLDRFRDFINVSDVVSAFLAALDTPATIGQTYLLGSGRKATVKELLEHLCAAFDDPDHDIIVEDGTPGDQLGLYCDNTKLKEQLGWAPQVSLASGIKQLVTIEQERNLNA